MKKEWKCCLAALGLALVLGGCSKTITAEDLAGKTYEYEKEGFGGNFTIQLKEDGTFTYYEGGLSSYIGIPGAEKLRAVPLRQRLQPPHRGDPDPPGKNQTLHFPGRRR